MFNAKQKEQFLNSIAKENSYRSYLSILNKCERFEQSYGKDVADMTLTEVLSLLDMISGKSAQSVANCRSLLGNYVDWCIRNGKSVMTENNISKISYTSIDKQRSFKISYVGSDKELYSILDEAFPEEGYDFNEGINAIRRSIILLLYNGMEIEELMNLKKQNIDYENNIVYSPLYEKIIYHVDEKLLGYLKICAELEEIVYHVDQKKRPEKLCMNDYIYRSKIGKQRPIDYDGTVAKTFIWKRYRDMNDIYSEVSGIYKNLTALTLADSKRFYDYYMTKDKEAFLDALKVEFTLKSDKNDRQIYIAILNFKRNYEMWKKAFH